MCFGFFAKEKHQERLPQPLPSQGVVLVTERKLPELEIQRGLNILSLVLPPKMREVVQQAIKP